MLDNAEYYAVLTNDIMTVKQTEQFAKYRRTMPLHLMITTSDVNNGGQSMHTTTVRPL